MNVTKACILTMIAAGSMIACGSALAQETPKEPAPAPAPAMSTNGPAGAHMMRGPSVDGLARALKLTDAQKAQVQPILAEEYKKMRELRNDTSLSVSDRRAKMKEIRDETSDKLEPILTPEQLDKWKSRTQPPHHPRPQGPNVSTNTPAGSAP